MLYMMVRQKHLVVKYNAASESTHLWRDVLRRKRRTHLDPRAAGQYLGGSRLAGFATFLRRYGGDNVRGRVGRGRLDARC